MHPSIDPTTNPKLSEVYNQLPNNFFTPTNDGKQFSAFAKVLDSLPDDLKKQLFIDISRALDMGIKSIILKNLKPEDKEGFEKLLEEGNSADMLIYAKSKIPDFDTEFNKIVAEVSDAAAEYIEDYKYYLKNKEHKDFNGWLKLCGADEE